MSYSQRKQAVIHWAQSQVGRLEKEQGRWCVLDTETTGLNPSLHEVIEIAVLDALGKTIYESLITTKNPEEEELQTKLHGITRGMLDSAPAFPTVWDQLYPILKEYKHILVYNAPFDSGMLRGMARRYGISFPEQWDWHCIFDAFNRFYGEPHPRGGWKYQSLDTACRTLKIGRQQTHRAAADALDAYKVLHALAALDPKEK